MNNSSQLIPILSAYLKSLSSAQLRVASTAFVLISGLGMLLFSWYLYRSNLSHHASSGTSLGMMLLLVLVDGITLFLMVGSVRALTKK